MKKWAQQIIDFKMSFAVVWIGMLVLYMLSKTILGVYSVSFITLLEFVGVAIVITCVEYLYTSELVKKTHTRAMIVVEEYILITLIILGFNRLFQFYQLEGIEYLYFIIGITFAYFGAQFGFYLMNSLGVHILNQKLTAFQNRNNEKK